MSVTGEDEIVVIPGSFMAANRFPQELASIAVKVRCRHLISSETRHLTHLALAQADFELRLR
jgi:hypothetical protein